MRTRLSLRLVILACALGVGFPAPAEEVTVTDLGNGAFAVLQPKDQRFNDSNAVFFIGDSDVVVIDTQATAAATQRVLQAIRKRTELPVAFVVHTHWHGDHVQGDGVYREAYPGVRFVGHRTHREDIPGRAGTALREDIDRLGPAIEEGRKLLESGVNRDGEPLDEATRKRYGVQIEAAERRLAGMREVSLPLRPPDLTFDAGMTIHRPGRTIELIHAVAHTRGDVIVHVPEQGLLLTGDVLDDLPYGGHGYPAAWVGVLDELEALPFSRIVPGHGSIREGDAAREHLRTVREMFRMIVAGARAAVADGKDLEATAASIDLGSFEKRLVGDDPVAQRNYNAFIPATVERAWLEARGELDPTNEKGPGETPGP